MQSACPGPTSIAFPSTVQVKGPSEGSGYITRSALPQEGGARIVRLTKRGHAAYAKMADILREIEREWTAELGAKRFAELKALLALLWNTPLVR